VFNNYSKSTLNNSNSNLDKCNSSNLLKNESLLSLCVDEMILKNKDVSLKPSNCLSNISLNLSTSNRLNVMNTTRNSEINDRCISRSSDRDIWKKRIENVNNEVEGLPDMTNNIDKLAEAMGMNKINFDYDATYQDCSKEEINQMIKLNSNKGVDIEIDDVYSTELKNILNDIGEPMKSKSTIVKSDSSVDILHD